MKNKYSPLYEEMGEGSLGGSAPVEPAGSLSTTPTASLSGTDGSSNTPPPDFHSALNVSDEVRGWDGYGNVKDASDAVTQLYNAQKMIGVEKMAKPQEGWTDEQWNQHHIDLGRPVESKGYEFSEISEEHADLFDSEVMDGFKDIFHEAGLSSKQANNIMDAYKESHIEMVGAQQEAMEAQNLASMNELVSEYGDKFEGNMHLAQKAVQEVGLSDTLKELGVDTDPRLIRAFVQIGSNMLESSPVDGVASFNVNNAAQAQHTISQFSGNADKMAALHDNRHPAHDAVKNEWKTLHETAYPIGS